MQKSLFNETLMHTKLLHAKDMKTRVANQIMEDVKEERTKSEDLLHASIALMQQDMLKRRVTTYQFDNNNFVFVCDSCKPFARELLIAKLKLLGYNVTCKSDIIFVACESNEGQSE